MTSQMCLHCGKLLTKSEIHLGYCPKCGNDLPRPPKKSLSTAAQGAWALAILAALAVLVVAVLAGRASKVKSCKERCDSVASYCDLRASTVFQQIVCREDARACRDRCER